MRMASLSLLSIRIFSHLLSISSITETEKMVNSCICIVVSGAFEHDYHSKLSAKVGIAKIKFTSNSNQLRCSGFANAF